MNIALQGLCLTLLTGLIWGGVGILFSLAVRKNLDFPSFVLSASGLIFLISLFVTPDYRAILSGNAFSKFFDLMFVMLAVAATTNLGILKMKGAMQCGHQGFAWAISQSAMVLPFIFALFFWNEKAHLSRLGGVVLILASFAFLSIRELRQQDKTSNIKSETSKNVLRWIFLSASAFLLIGISQIFSMVPSHWGGWSDKGALRLPLLFAFSLVFWAAYFFIKGGKFHCRATLLHSLAYTVFVISGQITLYKSLDLMAAAKMSSVVYPMSVGTCIMVVVVYSALALREKFGISGLLGILMTLLGIILISV